jgi:hypothetical protein
MLIEDVFMLILGICVLLSSCYMLIKRCVQDAIMVRQLRMQVVPAVPVDMPQVPSLP